MFPRVPLNQRYVNCPDDTRSINWLQLTPDSYNKMSAASLAKSWAYLYSFWLNKVRQKHFRIIPDKKFKANTLYFDLISKYSLASLCAYYRKLLPANCRIADCWEYRGPLRQPVECQYTSKTNRAVKETTHSLSPNFLSLKVTSDIYMKPS